MPISAGFTIPISVILIPLGLFLIFYIFYSIFNVYHLVRFGVYGYGLYAIVALFTVGTIFLMALSGFFITRYDWSEPISFDSFLEVDDERFPGI